MTQAGCGALERGNLWLLYSCACTVTALLSLHIYDDPIHTAYLSMYLLVLCYYRGNIAVIIVMYIVSYVLVRVPFAYRVID